MFSHPNTFSGFNITILLHSSNGLPSIAGTRGQHLDYSSDRLQILTPGPCAKKLKCVSQVRLTVVELLKNISEPTRSSYAAQVSAFQARFGDGYLH